MAAGDLVTSAAGASAVTGLTLFGPRTAVIILGIGSANEKQRHVVTSYLIAITRMIRALLDFCQVDPSEQISAKF